MGLEDLTVVTEEYDFLWCDALYSDRYVEKCSTDVGDDLRTPHTVACNPPSPTPFSMWLHFNRILDIVPLPFLHSLAFLTLSPYNIFPSFVICCSTALCMVNDIYGWLCNITTCCCLTAWFLWNCLSVVLWWADLYFYFQFSSFRCISAHAGCSAWCLDLPPWQCALLYLSPSL